MQMDSLSELSQLWYHSCAKQKTYSKPHRWGVVCRRRNGLCYTAIPTMVRISKISLINKEIEGRFHNFFSWVWYATVSFAILPVERWWKHSHCLLSVWLPLNQPQSFPTSYPVVDHHVSHLNWHLRDLPHVRTNPYPHAFMVLNHWSPSDGWSSSTWRRVFLPLYLSSIR